MDATTSVEKKITIECDLRTESELLLVMRWQISFHGKMIKNKNRNSILKNNRHAE